MREYTQIIELRKELMAINGKIRRQETKRKTTLYKLA